MAALNHEVPDRIPVVPQAFMFACKTAGYTIGQINKSGKLMAETHLISQAKYGYDGVVIDIDDCSLAGPNLISPKMYREIALEHEIKLVREIQEYGIPVSLHICGDTSLILEYMVQTKAKIFE